MNSVLNNSPKLFLILILNLAVLAVAEPPSQRVGVIAPLTGPMATIGNALKNGIELARMEQPGKFQALSFVYEDDQYDPKRSVTAYKKLRGDYGVKVIFLFGDSPAYAVSSLSERDGVVVLNFSFEAGPAKGKKLLVRSMNYTGQYMAKMADYLVKESPSRFAIIRAESPFFNGMADSFLNSLGSSKEVLSDHRVNPNELDFRTMLIRLKSAQPPAVGLFLTPEQLISFVKQGRELNFSTTLFGTDLFETATGIPSGEGLFEGAVYPDNEADAGFRSRYKSQYNNEAQLTFAGSGYDMAVLAGEILARDPQQKGDEIVSALSRVSARDGVLGRFDFVADRENGMFFAYPVRVKRIQGGIGVAAD